MGPDHYDGCLDIARNHRSNSRSAHSHGRKSKFSVNQDIVKTKIDNNRSYSGLHGDKRLTAFPQGCGVCLGKGKAWQSYQHYVQIQKPRMHCRRKVSAIGTLVQIKAYQIPAEERHYENRTADKDGSQHKLEPERVPDPFRVSLAEVLRRKDPGSGKASEDAEVVHEQKLVDNRHTGHLLRSQTPDHDVVQQIHEIGESVLDHNGESDHEYGLEQCLVALDDLHFL